MATLESILLLIITVILLALCLFLADRIIGDKPKFTSAYFIKALLTAVVIVIIIIGVNAVIGLIDVLGIGQIATILAFVLSCYAIKMLLLETSDFEKSVWVGVITWLLVYVIDYISLQIGGQGIIQFI